MVSKNYEETIERNLDEFVKKRDQIGNEIIKIRDVAKRMIDEMFNNLLENLLAESSKTDDTIDERIKDIKKSLSSLKDIDSYLDKARSVFNSTIDNSYVKAF